MSTAKELLKSLEENFDGSKVDANTLFHFVLEGDSGGDFTVEIEDGACKVSEGLTGDAKCVVKSTDQTFIDVLTKKVNPTMAVMSGKLKISNIGEMMKFAKPFGLM